MSKEIEAECPECGYQVDDASGLGDAEGERPTEDCIAICIRCAAVGIYVRNENGSLGLRAPSEEEKVELSEEPQIERARAAILLMVDGWLK